MEGGAKQQSAAQPQRQAGRSEARAGQQQSGRQLRQKTLSSGFSPAEAAKKTVVKNWLSSSPATAAVAAPAPAPAHTPRSAGSKRQAPAALPQACAGPGGGRAHLLVAPGGWEGQRVAWRRRAGCLNHQKVCRGGGGQADWVEGESLGQQCCGRMAGPGRAASAAREAGVWGRQRMPAAPQEPPAHYWCDLLWCAVAVALYEYRARLSLESLPRPSDSGRAGARARAGPCCDGISHQVPGPERDYVRAAHQERRLWVP